MPRETEVVLQADIGGVTIAFTETAPADESTLNERLDLYTRAIARQKAKLDLSQQLLALQINDKMLGLLPERMKSEVRARLEERTRLVASFEGEHLARQRRGEFKLTDAQRKALDQFDQQTTIQGEKLDREKRDLERDRPIIESQISRLRAVIAGRDPTEYVPEGAAQAA